MNHAVQNVHRVAATRARTRVHVGDATTWCYARDGRCLAQQKDAGAGGEKLLPDASVIDWSRHTRLVLGASPSELPHLQAWLRRRLCPTRSTRHSFMAWEP